MSFCTQKVHIDITGFLQKDLATRVTQ